MAFKRRKQQWLGALALGMCCAGCDGSAVAESPPAASESPRASLQIATREGKLRDYPCSRCHDKVTEADATGGRGPHTEVVVQHFEAADECDVCHDRNHMNRLQLLGERHVGFDESYALCGQCHSEKLSDWRIGAHGKHIGSWQRKRYRLTCTDCHDAHHPRRPSMRAQPAPPFPARGIPKGGHR